MSFTKVKAANLVNTISSDEDNRFLSYLVIDLSYQTKFSTVFGVMHLRSTEGVREPHKVLANKISQEE